MNEQATIEFLGEKYTKQSIQGLKKETLLEIRNLVAENMGLTRVKSLPAGQEAEKCWSALLQYQKSVDNGEDPAVAGDKIKAEKKEKPKKSPDQRIKKSRVQEPKRPTKSMFRRVHHIAPHPGKGHRIARWPLYTEGLRIIDAMMSPEMEHADLPYYVDHGFIQLVEPTDDEFAKEEREWYASVGRKHPDDAKAEADAKREEERKAKAAKAEADAKVQEEA